jgi:hypothetical protein
VLERNYESRDGQQGVRMRVLAPRSLLRHRRGLLPG